MNRNQFKYLIGILLLLSLINFLPSFKYKSNTSKTIQYINGNVYQEGNFVRKDFSVVHGKLTFKQSDNAGEVVDLRGKYVIPPLADAHTHNFDDVGLFDSIYNAYVEEGTFYIQVLTNHYSSYLHVKDCVNGPGKIDVAFAHGGLTATGGHPHALYETRSMGLGWRAMLDPDNIEKIRNGRSEEKDAYYLLDTKDDVNTQWKEIIDNEPNLLKIYLSNFGKRNEEIESGNVGTYGLTKEVTKLIINKAKEEKIPVYAHIESVDDFIWALDNGVSHYAHMPGYGGGYGKKDLSAFIIPDEILKKAAEHKVVITPTVSFTKYYAQAWNGMEMTVDSVLYNEKKNFLRDQLRRMHDAGIIIALGADQNGSTLMEEIEDLIDINDFNNHELLEIILNTSRVIFPSRKIGKLQEGFEASFLVLDENPLEDMTNLKRISSRIKDGLQL